MQSSKEEQGEIRKPFLSDQPKEKEENNKWERLEISSRILRVTKGNISCKDGHNKGQKQYGPNRGRRY